MDFKQYPENIKQIDIETHEGRLLFAAIGQIKNRCHPDLSADQILILLTAKAKNIFTDDN